MEAKLAEHVWHKNIGVLILLVWVARLVANTSSKSKFGDTVEPISRNLHLVGCWLNRVFRRSFLLRQLL